jgi:hypothetical protein
VPAGAQVRREGLRHPPGAEEVGVERSLHAVEVDGEGAGVGVVIDRGVVDEDVEAPGPRRERGDVVGIVHVEACGAHVAVAGHRGRDRRGAILVARREPDRHPGLGQLSADLDAESARTAGDEGHPAFV